MDMRDVISLSLQSIAAAKARRRKWLSAVLDGMDARSVSQKQRAELANMEMSSADEPAREIGRFFAKQLMHDMSKENEENTL